MYKRRANMNDFEKKIAAHLGEEGLFSDTIETLQVNIGLRCNQHCFHCHVESSPERQETMGWPVMELILQATEASHCRLVDITGGAPELNPSFRQFCDIASGKRLSCPGTNEPDRPS